MEEKEIRLTLAENIKLNRARRNWSQADLSEKTGLSIVFISDIERGNKWPYLDSFMKLAIAFEIEVFELLKPKDNIPKSTTIILAKYQEETIAIIEKSIENMKKNIFSSVKNLRKHYTSS